VPSVLADQLKVLAGWARDVQESGRKMLSTFGADCCTRSWANNYYMDKYTFNYCYCISSLIAIRKGSNARFDIQYKSLAEIFKFNVYK